MPPSLGRYNTKAALGMIKKHRETSEALTGESNGVSNEDQTQYQTEGGRSSSKKLSMQATGPPSEVPGYRLERFLGSGAFGQVWVGRDLNTGRPVAIKFFLHRGGVNWSLLSHEVKNLVQLSADRHIVQVLEVGWDNDPPYYVMELVTGGSLEEMLTERGELPVGEAVALFRRICVGLNHSHSKGVLHCDLKPANILLGEDHEPRLADFGQSRMTHDQTPALGTLFYMAPEQADLGSTPSSSWDVYAVGAIMYRMLTGGPPYRDDSIVEQLDTAGSLPKRLQRYRESIQQATPPIRHIQQTGVDRELARIVSRCLAADPADRFTNVQEILDRLDRRSETRARRPLLLLGILGPLLLLLATSLYAVRTINYASDSTEQLLRQEALSSNQLAAKFAAKTLEGELERYFRLCRDEMNRNGFRQTLSAALSDSDLQRELKTIADQGTSKRALKMVDTRLELLANSARIELDQYLSKRLERYTSPETESRVPRLATMFVTDASGTIFSIVYDAPVPQQQNSAGRNYAYRTYYHGGKNDLPVDTPIESLRPALNMHLSAAFQSTATGLWKVAISAPIWLDGSAKERPDAVFVATINLGDFDLLQGDSGSNQVAALVEAREGPMRGTVLQHPYMEQRYESGRKVEKYQVPPEKVEQLLQGGDVDYRDPVAREDDADEYDGDWIAAMQPVNVPDAEPFDADDPSDQVTQAAGPAQGHADLLVLVQYRLSKVFAPVGSMRQSLLRQGAAALLALILLSGAIFWFFLRHATRERGTGRSQLIGANGLLGKQAVKDTSKPMEAVDMTETLETPDANA
ncbi:protein kinase [Stieleria sp. TO1_6]|uniref:protein kinase domain-containing protein n=1 Tax=Stieleria tagensis TaxID=2956795 RepID=UPI00209B0B24|nr:protein kinase [Stieleria tagensis]MCO8120808.1 protein kinase [Stieleria tagensis]